MIRSHTAVPLLVFFALVASAARGQSPSDKVNCYIVQPRPISAAEAAFRKSDFATSESLFRATAASASDEQSFADATFGLVRSLIEENRGRDAVDTASAALKRYTKNSVLLDALGSAYFYRGEMDKASATLNAAQSADFCNPRIHYDIARFLHLNAEYGSEQRQLQIAHRIAPQDPTFALAIAERNGLKIQSKGGCEAVNPLPSAQIPIVPFIGTEGGMYAAGLEVSLNGKKRRFELDTGETGLLIGRSVAQAAGIIGETEGAEFGIGDRGGRREMLAYVDNIQIGNIQFHNCLVRILDQKYVLDVDGLIGADVFSSYIVTIDIRGRMLRLSPLPPPPGETIAATALHSDGGDPQDRLRPTDRYVPPEMANWTRVLRSGHLLIFPTIINRGPPRLFVMDTGSAHHGLISIEAAKEVAEVSESSYGVHGISGRVNKVKNADEVTILFGGVRQLLEDVPAIDLARFSRSAGVEISGFIGFTTLRELTISIDYRDSLVQITYDPRHGFHDR